MRHRYLFAMILLVGPAAAFGQDDDTRAVTVARDILDRGAALFDKRDAAAMAATYVETAEIIVIKRASDSDRFVTETRQGRTAIERAYAEIFKDRLPEHRCRNTVESARFMTQDLLLIRGRFAMNREQGDASSSSRSAHREGDQWKVVTMQLMELPGRTRELPLSSTFPRSRSAGCRARSRARPAGC